MGGLSIKGLFALGIEGGQTIWSIFKVSSRNAGWKRKYLKKKMKKKKNEK